ncbi:hypothetical protein FRC07_008211 [Ceratobasidium sp. 392]|nr:hypothetical protein FRC07_008211 [Ceratobasidium sp. 392]
MAPQSFARSLWAVRQALFPSFEEKGYHLQFRHGVLITIMLMCASFTLPANPQTKPFPDSDYSPDAEIPVEVSYNLIHRFVNGIMWYNVGVAAFIALHLVAEPPFKRGAPVWFELFWMSLLVIGETVCLGLMGSSRPPVCDFNFGVDATIVLDGKFTPMNSATSICSNWRGMTGLLAAIITCFLLHIVWHMVVSIRFISQRKNVFTLPITDYRWTLSKELARVNQTFPADVEAASPKESKQHQQHTDSFDYSAPSFPTSSDYKGATTTATTDTLSFPATVGTEEYNNYSRPAHAKMDALPAARKQPVVLEQSIVAQSDTSSIAEGSSPITEAPFNYSRRI